MPFRRDFETLQLEKCNTVQEIINKLVPFNFADCRFIVTVNNEILTSDKWAEHHLKKGDIVGLNVVPTGGGNGKNPIVTILSIVAAVTVAYFAPQAGAAIGAAIFGAGEGAVYAGTALYLIGTSMVLSLATSALMSTPKQQTDSSKEGRVQYIEGASNAINKYGVVPANLGTNRMFPPQAALPYTETSGNNQYVRQLFTYGYGKVMVTERKIGETNISDFEEVEISDRLEADLNQNTTLYTNDVYQEAFNVKITHADGSVIRTTQSNANECEIDLTFQGLASVNDEGGKNPAAVSFEIQFAPTGTENWSATSAGFEVEDSQGLTIDLRESYYYPEYQFRAVYKSYQKNYFIILNLTTGVVSYNTVQTFANNVAYPSLSPENIVLGYINGKTLEFVDNRANFIGTYIESINDFVVTLDKSNLATSNVTIGSGKIIGIPTFLTVTDATTQVIRKVKRIVFPSTGQYDIKITRVTGDSTSDKLLTDSYLTAIRSISYISPVNFPDISGTSLRIRATDQLNGSISSYNCVVSTLIKSYDTENRVWVDNVPSSNPADLYRYVLQSPAFAKHEDITDNRIDLQKLEEWAVYCEENGLTYNRVIDYEVSIDEVLNDICAAGVATLSKVNNIYSVIIDNERPIIKGLITPRNSWDYSGNVNYPEIPHALRVEFRNAEKGYETDERIVYADGYDESTATLYERLQFESCTNAELAYWYGRRYFATALLQPEVHTFKMDFECLTFERGDRIQLVNDVILAGVGQGRITSLYYDDNGDVTGFVLDDTLTIPPVTNLAVRIRDNDAKGITYHLLQTVEGEQNSFVFMSTVPIADAPVIGSLCAFVEDGKELDLIVTEIKSGSNQTATIKAIDYAPARFDPIGEIPPFESNITIAQDFYKPYAPELAGNIQTDESVMVRNSDGSLLSVMIVPLINRNEPNIVPYIRVKRVGTTDWYIPTYLKKEPNQVIITGLEDGVYYDVDIRYQRQTGLQLLSDPLLINNIKFIGGSSPPKKVQNFRMSVMNGMALFEWSPNDDIDISHYVIRYSASTDNVTWESAQIVMDRITSTSITNIVHKGVYLIKAVDMLGNTSSEATVIFSNETGAFKNVVEELIQQPDWLGVKENIVVSEDMIELNMGQRTGYYYFEPAVVDLGDIYECSLTANVKSLLTKRNRIRDVLDVRAVSAVRDIGKNINTDVDWVVELQMSLSNDNVTWSDWEPFIAAKQQFRACKFRLFIRSDSELTTPQVSIAQVTIDMPDRYESGEDIQITNANEGYTLLYENPFRNSPSVNITLQDGSIDDRIEYAVKNNKGFTLKVFNGTSNGYVIRSFDYLAAGYGKVISEV